MPKDSNGDAGHEIVDNQLADLEDRIRENYREAARDVSKDLNAFMDKYIDDDKRMREKVQAGQISENDYKDWKQGKLFQSEAMDAKVADLTERMVRADVEASAMINGELPQVYATSYNFAGYKAEAMMQYTGHDYTSFTIVNQDAIRTLSTQDPDLIPWTRKTPIPKDAAWNRQHIQAAIQQGLLQGDDFSKLSKRLLPVVNQDATAAMRTARTAVTGIENKGRLDATERVVSEGVPMRQRWRCTHDDRTRDSHILMDGEEIEVGGVFSNGLRYPADPAGDPSEVYNCRCELEETLEGIDHSKDAELYEQFMSTEHFEEWQIIKANQEEKEQAFQQNKRGAPAREEKRKRRN